LYDYLKKTEKATNNTYYNKQGKGYILERCYMLKLETIYNDDHDYFRKNDINSEKQQKQTNQYCDVLRSFATLMNKTDQYDKKIIYKNHYIGPDSLADDIYGGVHGYLACNLYFDKK